MRNERVVCGRTKISGSECVNMHASVYVSTQSFPLIHSHSGPAKSEPLLVCLSPSRALLEYTADLEIGTQRPGGWTCPDVRACLQCCFLDSFFVSRILHVYLPKPCLFSLSHTPTTYIYIYNIYHRDRHTRRHPCPHPPPRSACEASAH